MCRFKKSNVSDLMPSGGWQMTRDIKLTNEKYQIGHDQRLTNAELWVRVKCLFCGFGFHTLV